MAEFLPGAKVRSSIVLTRWCELDLIRLQRRAEVENRRYPPPNPANLLTEYPTQHREGGGEGVEGTRKYVVTFVQLRGQSGNSR